LVHDEQFPTSLGKGGETQGTSDARYRHLPCTKPLPFLHTGVLIIQFEGWENGLLTADMSQAMLSGCIVAMTEPQIQHGQSLEHWLAFGTDF
jgi:hypothetical protein